MKNLKKVLALVLAFACAFTMFAGAAFTDQADIPVTRKPWILWSLWASSTATKMALSARTTL